MVVIDDEPSIARFSRYPHRSLRVPTLREEIAELRPRKLRRFTGGM